MAGLEGAVHRYHEHDGLRWHWVEAGAGEPLVLLHGLPETWHGWAPLIPELARSRRVLAFDLPGFGGTSVLDGDHSFAAVASRLAALLESLGIGTFALAGHDWGGLVAVRLAGDLPDRVTAYAHVAAPTDRFDLTRLPDYLDLWLDPDEAPYLIDMGDVFVQRAYDAGWRGGADRMSPELLERRVNDFDRGSVETAMSRWFRDLELADDWRLIEGSAPLWERLTMPVLIVVGDRDLRVTPESALAVEEILPQATLAIVDDSGHYPASEQPEQTARLLRELFDGDPER